MKESTNFIKKEDMADFSSERALDRNSLIYKEKMLRRELIYRRAVPLVIKSKRNLLDLSPHVN